MAKQEPSKTSSKRFVKMITRDGSLIAHFEDSGTSYMRHGYYSEYEYHRDREQFDYLLGHRCREKGVKVVSVAFTPELTSVLVEWL